MNENSALADIPANSLDREPIVIIDDDKSIGKTLKLHFERQGYKVYTSLTANDGLNTLESLDSAIIV
ncbi:hypothetical protein MNBD_NITROSPINAE03-1832, partial [hydrothermal vent metagenome]